MARPSLVLDNPNTEFDHYDDFGRPVDTNGQIITDFGGGTDVLYQDPVPPDTAPPEDTAPPPEAPPTEDTAPPPAAAAPPPAAAAPPPEVAAPLPADNPFAPWSGHFTTPAAAPLPDVPVFTPPVYTPPPKFSYDAPQPTFTPPDEFSYADFQAPSYEAATQDPGYQFRLQQGTNALQNAAAARGTLNDSGTLKALIDYGQGAASQEYANVYGRAADTYSTNYKNAAGAYDTNYKTQYVDPYNNAVDAWKLGHDTALDSYNTNYKTQYEDPYTIAYQSAKDVYAPQFASWQTNAANTQHANDTTNTNAWNDYLLGYQDYQNRRNLGVNFALAS